MNSIDQYNMLLVNGEILLNAYENKVKNKYFFKEGQRVISICKEWKNNDEITADDIYETVDSEERYNIVEFGCWNGINEEESYMWILLSDIVCVLCSLAYEIEEQECVPQAIECIIDEEIEAFVIFINENMKVYENIKECVEYFAEKACY